MSEEKKIIQLDTSQTEDRLKEAMPVLSAPESLSAENVALALSGVKKARRIPLSKYIGAAVAAVLVLAIGIGVVSGGLLNRKGAMAPDAAMPEDTDGSPSGGYNYIIDDPEPTDVPDEDYIQFYIHLESDSGRVTVELDGDVYEGFLDDGVPFDGESAKRYLGISGLDTATFANPGLSAWHYLEENYGGGHSLYTWSSPGDSDVDGTRPEPRPRCYVPAEGETDADLCIVLTLEDGRELIIFLYEQ